MIRKTETVSVDIHLQVDGIDADEAAAFLEAARQDVWYALRHESYEIVEVSE